MPAQKQQVLSDQAEGRHGIRRRGMYLGLMVLALASAAAAQERGDTNSPGQGHMQRMTGEGARDMQTIHALFGSHKQIARAVKKLEDGVETLTESNDPKVQPLIREHVRSMYQRLSDQRPIRMWDPLYAEIFKQSGKIKMEIRNTAKGIQVIETSTDPWVVKLLHAHADGVSEFVEEGMAAMHKEHRLPSAIPERATLNMKLLPLRASIETGKDKEVEQLFEGPGRKLVQITLRNNGTLDAHKAAVPITIQCVAGSGTLKAGDGTDYVELKPGVLVTIEANVMHEIKANPAVSILLTQFTAKP